MPTVSTNFSQNRQDSYLQKKSMKREDNGTSTTQVPEDRLGIGRFVTGSLLYRFGTRYVNNFGVMIDMKN